MCLKVQAGWQVVVDVDLEKFFDRVNHDVLMDRLAMRIDDQRVLRLIGRYLDAGIMSQGVLVERYEGTPQGGPLSPLLANVLLDEVDRELERRRHEGQPEVEVEDVGLRQQPGEGAELGREPQRQRAAPVERPVGLGVELPAVEDDEPGVDPLPTLRLDVLPGDAGDVHRGMRDAKRHVHLGRAWKRQLMVSDTVS